MYKLLTTGGAAAGIPLALLINRYLLGNKSTSSAVLSALLGAGAGATGGYGVGKYLEGSQLDDALRNEQVRKKVTDQYDKNVDTIVSYLHEDQDNVKQMNAVAAQIVTDLANSKDLESDVAAKLQLLDKFNIPVEDKQELIRRVLNVAAQLRSANFKLEDGMDTPLFSWLSTDKATGDRLTDKLHTFIRLGKLRLKDAEIANLRRSGAINPGAEVSEKSREYYGGNRLNAIGVELGINPERAKAMMAYNNIAFHLANQFYGDQLGDGITKALSAAGLDRDDLKDPNVIDYLTIRLMPKDMRRNIPVIHRITATQRAKASNGWSYELDNLMMQDPQVLHEQLYQRVGKDAVRRGGVNLTTAAFNFMPGAPGAIIGNLVIPIAFTAANFIKHRGELKLSAWKPSNNYAGNSFLESLRNAYIRRRAGDALTGDVALPVYAFMLPHINEANKTINNVDVATGAIDFIGDIYGYGKFWKAPRTAAKNKLARFGGNALTHLGMGVSTFGNAKAAVNYARDPHSSMWDDVNGISPQLRERLQSGGFSDSDQETLFTNSMLDQYKQLADIADRTYWNR